MVKRVFIVPGWNETPNDAWIPWLVKEAGKSGIHAMAVFMPNPNEPYIDSWVYHLNSIITSPDSETFFVGHSMGCQAILRYMEQLDHNVKVGGVIMVAPWVHLNQAAFDNENDIEVARPWLETPIEWDVVKKHTENFEAIFSDNDPYVPIADYKIFREKLNANTVVENRKGHYDSHSNTLKLPRVLLTLLKMAGVDGSPVKS